MGVLYDPTLYTGSDLVTGNLVVQDNAFEGDYGEILEGAADASGHIYSVYSHYSEAALTVRNNTIHNAPWAVYFIVNGAQGKAFNAIVERNTITEDCQSATGMGTQAITALEWASYIPATDSWFVPTPGTNLTANNNTIDVSYPAAWFGQLAVDAEVYGQASVTQNTVKVNGGSGIGFWFPTQNGVVKNNRISGAGDYAFFTLPGSNGNQFVNNHAEGFTPTGGGAFDFGLGNPAVPAARGALFSDDNIVKGAGAVDPLDIVYDCGLNNQIRLMIAAPCPGGSAVTAGPQSAQAEHGASAQARAKMNKLQPHRK